MLFNGFLSACQCLSVLFKSCQVFCPSKGGRQGWTSSDFYPLGGLVSCTTGQWLSFIFGVHVSDCQGVSRVVKYFAPERGGRLLIFISSVDWSFVFGFSVVVIPF